MRALSMNNNSTSDIPKIGAPALRALKSMGINTISQLSQYSEEQLLALHGMGPKALGILKLKLRENDLSLR